MLPTVINESGHTLPDISCRHITTAVTEALKTETLAPLSIVYVTQEKGGSLNKEYRSGTFATNVLSFAETRDIIITPAIVEREAQEQGVSFVYWLTYLIVHGMLHLEGYTHTTAAEATVMEDLEERIMYKIESS